MTKTSKAKQSKILKNVAKRLGVSYASISRSFNTEPTNNSSHDGSLHVLGGRHVKGRKWNEVSYRIK